VVVSSTKLFRCTAQSKDPDAIRVPSHEPVTTHIPTRKGKEHQHPDNHGLWGDCDVTATYQQRGTYDDALQHPIPPTWGQVIPKRECSLHPLLFSRRYEPPPISSNASILFPRSPPFASSTRSRTSASMLGNIWARVLREAALACACALSISACTADKSRDGVGVREICGA